MLAVSLQSGPKPATSPERVARDRQRGRSYRLPSLLGAALVCIACSATERFSWRQGQSCDRSSQCASNHCERTQRNDERVCCAIECVPGTVCATDGSRCVTCDPALQSCNVQRAPGERCAGDAECGSGICRPDERLLDRCCAGPCNGLCDERGQCLDGGAVVDPTAATGSTRANSGTGAAPAFAQGGSSAGPSTASGARAPAPGATAPPSTTAASGCGDGRLDAGEDCDNGGENTDGVPGACNRRCKFTECDEGAFRSCGAGGLLGNCAAGEQSCDEGRWSACSVRPAASDSCETADDDADCNGIPNEGCPCIEGSERRCGPTSDQGACAFGVSTCENGAMSPCRGAVFPSARDCGSPDDFDCDGRPDNTQDATCPCILGQTESCDQHAGFDGKGNCKAGKRGCELGSDGISSRWGLCLGSVAPQSSDSCLVNGDDSNCNGVANDGCNQSNVDYLWSFDSGIGGWEIRLTDPERLRANAKLEFAGDLGDPDPGSLVVKMPFDGSNQKIEFNVSPSPALDVTGRIFRARVRLASGLSADKNAPGGIKLFAKSGSSYVYVSGRWSYLTEVGAWVDVSLDPAAPDLSTGKFDLKNVREVGFELRTFSDTKQVAPAVVNVDSVYY
jgi:hypothetical protein